jgi:hypothetical protein
MISWTPAGLCQRAGAHEHQRHRDIEVAVSKAFFDKLLKGG